MQENKMGCFFLTYDVFILFMFFEHF